MAYGNRAKYCDVCKVEQARKQEAEYRKRARQKKPEGSVHACDSFEQIQICLNCTEKKCKSGKCEAVLALNRSYTRLAPEELAKRREQVLELSRDKSLSLNEIGRRLGCPVGTVRNDLDALRRKGVAV